MSGSRAVVTSVMLTALTLSGLPLFAQSDRRVTAIALKESGPSSSTNQPVLLSQALDETLLKSPRAAAIRSQLGIARSAITEATVMANPLLNIDNGYVAEQTYGVSSTIPFELPWKLVLRLLTARRQITEAELEISRNLWLLRAEVRRTYTELFIAQEMADTLVELAALSARLVTIADNRFKAGDVADLDVQKAVLASWQSDIERQQGLTRVVQSRQQLNVIMGREYKKGLAIPRLPEEFQLRAEKTDLLPDFEKPLPALDSLLASAMSRRLELKIIAQSIRTNEMRIKESYGNIMPNPLLTFGRAITGNPPEGPKLRGYHITANIELPVLDRQQGNIVRLRATIKSLKTNMVAQKNSIVAEVCSAYQKLVMARERIRMYQERVLSQSSKVARMASLSYQVGQSDITSALAAQQANIQVRSQHLDAVLAYQLALTDLEQAIGEPL